MLCKKQVLTSRELCVLFILSRWPYTWPYLHFARNFLWTHYILYRLYALDTSAYARCSKSHIRSRCCKCHQMLSILLVPRIWINIFTWLWIKRQLPAHEEIKKRNKRYVYKQCFLFFFRSDCLYLWMLLRAKLELTHYTEQLF